jgi:hypothetical protein
MLAYWFYKKRELINLNEHLGSPPVYLVKSVFLIGLVFCVAIFSFFYLLLFICLFVCFFVFLFLFVFTLCLIPNVACLIGLSMIGRGIL